jgi:hypothetical protein
MIFQIIAQKEGKNVELRTFYGFDEVVDKVR